MYLETNTYQIVSSFQQVRIPYKKAKRNGHPDVHKMYVKSDEKQMKTSGLGSSVTSIQPDQRH